MALTQSDLALNPENPYMLKVLSQDTDSFIDSEPNKSVICRCCLRQVYSNFEPTLNRQCSEI